MKEKWKSDENGKAHQLHLKNYIYFGMAFSFIVEVLNMVMRKKSTKQKVVELNEPILRPNEEAHSDSAH